MLPLYSIVNFRFDLRRHTIVRIEGSERCLQYVPNTTILPVQYLYGWNTTGTYCHRYITILALEGLHPCFWIINDRMVEKVVFNF